MRQNRTLVKTGIEDVIFTSQDCRRDMRFSSQDFDRSTTEGNLVRIRFCSSSVGGGWRDIVCGFQLYFGTESGIRVGCVYPIWDVMPDYVRAENETVLAVEACFQRTAGYNVVQSIKFWTNLRSFSPLGIAEGCTVYRHVGYDLTGFYGKAGHGITDLGTYFSRC